jgi:hypothetical protein
MKIKYTTLLKLIEKYNALYPETRFSQLGKYINQQEETGYCTCYVYEQDSKRVTVPRYQT